MKTLTGRARQRVRVVAGVRRVSTLLFLDIATGVN